jgi:hypothetical protein
MPFLAFLLIIFNISLEKLHPFIKDSSDFIQKTKHLHLDEHDIMVSFDVVSLFTKILVSRSH